MIVTNPPFGGMEEDGIETNFPASFRTRETADLFLVLIMHLLKDGGRAAIVLPDGTLFGEGVKTRIKEKLLDECNLHTIVRLPNGVFTPYTGIKTNLLFFTKGEPTKEVWYYEHPYPEGYKSYTKTKPMRIEEFEPEKTWWENRAGERAGLEGLGRGDQGQRLQPRHQEPQHRRGRPRRSRRAAGRVQDAACQCGRDAGEAEAGADGCPGAGCRCREGVGMTVETFFANFGHLADAPNGVQKLRELILQLAVQGKLVPQDPKDEPASVLLEKIELKQEAWLKQERFVKPNEV